VALLAHGTRNANGAGSAVELLGRFRWLVFELIVTGVPGAGNLDVWIQQSVDGGVNWADLLHFAQVNAGASGTDFQLASLPVRVSEGAGEMHLGLDAATAAGTIVATVMGREFRVKWTISAGSWDFQVLARLVG
jgi:hypothetical protein